MDACSVRDFTTFWQRTAHSIPHWAKSSGCLRHWLKKWLEIEWLSDKNLEFTMAWTFPKSEIPKERGIQFNAIKISTFRVRSRVRYVREDSYYIWQHSHHPNTWHKLLWGNSHRWTKNPCRLSSTYKIAPRGKTDTRKASVEPKKRQSKTFLLMEKVLEANFSVLEL